MLHGQGLGAESNRFLVLAGGEVIHGHPRINTVHALGRNIDFVQRLIDGNIRRANLSALSICVNINGAHSFEGVRIYHKQFAAGALRHIQQVILRIDVHVHAHIPHPAVRGTRKLQLLNLLSFQVNSRHIEPARHERLP